MTDRECRIPSGGDVSLNAMPIRLGVLRAGPVEAADPVESTLSQGEGRTARFEMELVPVQQAYVVFATDDASDVIPTMWCRTDNAGYCRIRETYRIRASASSFAPPEMVVPPLSDSPPDVSSNPRFGREHDLIPWESTAPGPSEDMLMTLSWFTAAYRVFWTYSPDVFDALRARMDEDYGAAIGEYGFRLVEPHALGPWRRDFTIEDNPIDRREQKRVSYFLSARDAVRYMPVYQEGVNFLESDEQQHEDEQADRSRYYAYCREGPIFDVTAEPLRALYLAEWAEAYEVQLRERSATHWSRLLRVRHIAEATERGEPIEGLQEQLRDAMERTDVESEPSRDAGVQLPAGVPDELAYPEPDEAVHRANRRRVMGLWAERFRQYAWECARAGVTRRSLALALDINPVNEAWRTAAHTIRDTTAGSEHGACLHPWHRFGNAGFGNLTLNGDAQARVLEYFDFYDIGFRPRTRQYVADVDARLDDVDTAFGWVAGQAIRRLTAIAPLPTFKAAAGRHAPHDDFHALVGRYTGMLSRHRVRWWESLEPPSTSDVGLQALLKAVARATGRSASFRDTFLKTFLTEQVKAYRWSTSQAEALLQRMYRYTLALDELLGEGGERTHVRFPDRTRLELEVDFGSGTVTTRGQLPAVDSVRVQFLSQLEPMPEAEAATSGGAQRRSMPLAERRRFRQARLAGQVRTFEVEVPIAPATAQRFRWGNLKEAADIVSTVVAFAGLAEELRGRELRVMTVVSATKELAALVGDAGKLYDLYRAARGVPDDAMPSVLRTLSDASPALKHAANVLGVLKDGHDVLQLMVGESAEANSALRRDDGLEYSLVAVRGVAQFLGASSAARTLYFTAQVTLGFVTEAAALAATGPLGTVYFAAGVAILVVEGALLVHRLLEGELDRFQRELAEAEDEELRIGRSRSAAGDANAQLPERRELSAEEQTRTWLAAAILNARMRGFVQGHEQPDAPVGPTD